MRPSVITLAIAGAALVPFAAATAQTDTGTPAQDLDCAIWASSLAGSTTDSVMQMGAATLVGYFVGRYEVATGRQIDDAMVARTLAMGDTGITAATQACAPRALLLGNRLSALGKRITDEAKKAAPK